MNNRIVTVLDGPTFVVSDLAGDIDGDSSEMIGMFTLDTRFLSLWKLTVNGERLTPLSVDDLRYFEARFFLVPGVTSLYVNGDVSVIRQRLVCDGLQETLTVINHGTNEVELHVRLHVGADFADLFEVKDNLSKKGRMYRHVDGESIVLGYERDAYHRETIVSTTGQAEVSTEGLTFHVGVPARTEWHTSIQANPVVYNRAGKVPLSVLLNAYGAGKRPDMQEELDKRLEQAPRLKCDDDRVSKAYRQSLVDIASLRLGVEASEHKLPAAGLPWFMMVFGRDSILTSLQALPFSPDLAVATLQELGLRQGTRIDDFRDEDPGRIIHEIRLGEMSAFEERPQSAYYGTADATPLYVILLDEYERWTGDEELVVNYEFEARAALNWINEYADLSGMGYIAYERRNERTGLENQCWKDSWDSISYSDGRLPGFPRATCELQGYAYDAKMRGARLARRFWKDPLYADLLEREASDLKRRFNRDFWVEEGQYYALALDADGGHVDALSSNIGHLLWSGIVDSQRASAVVRHLFGDRLFSGWGVRTLAAGEARYNPIGYHVGTVWPFDNSLIAWGLRRYGFEREAAQLAECMFEAAAFFGGRLPEAFAGYDRALTRYPVEYPTACSPQAWSSGAPLLLIRTMLGLDPIDDHLVVDPALPASVGHLEVLDIPGRWGFADAFGRGGADVRRAERNPTSRRRQRRKR